MQEKGQGLTDGPIIASSLLAEMGDTPVDWLVEGLVPKGAVVLVAAPPGTYKTWLALCLARAVAEGTPFAGRACMESLVLYIDGENPKGLICERVRRVGTSPRLAFWPMWCKTPPPPLGDPDYKSLAGAAPLIVFDSLVRFHNAEENSSTGMAPVMEALKAIAGAGATVLVLHHKGKGEAADYRGSSEILAGVQVAYTLRKLPHAKGQVELVGIKNHYAPEQKTALVFVEEGEGGPVRFAAAELPGEREEESPRERILELLKYGEMGIDEIAAQIGMSARKVSDQLEYLLHKQKIFLKRTGKGGRKSYSLTPF